MLAINDAARDWLSVVSWVYGRKLNRAALLPIATAQTLAKNDITSARYQRPNQGYFVQLEEMEKCRPSLYTVYGGDQNQAKRRISIELTFV